MQLQGKFYTKHWGNLNMDERGETLINIYDIEPMCVAQLD